MRKRTVALLLLVTLTAFFLTGCSSFNTKTSFMIDEKGMMDIEISLRADKLMAENEAKTFIWGILNSFPELQNNYSMTKETKKIDYDEYIYYTFETEKKIDSSYHKYISFNEESDGIYRFELKIPALLSEVSQSEEDTRAFTISVTLPEEIDISNSRNVEGNKATWAIYYHELTDETVLKALTA